SEMNRWLTEPYIDSEGSRQPARFDDKKYHIDYDISAIEALSDDMGKKVEWLNRATWLTYNEKREAIDYERSDNPLADELLLPAGMMPIGDSSFGDDMELRELVENYGLKMNGH